MNEIDVKIRQMVDHNAKVAFEFYRAGMLWYRTESGFLFPVPLADVGDATFKVEDRAVLFMRWIRVQVQVEAAYQRGMDAMRDMEGLT